VDAKPLLILLVLWALSRSSSSKPSGGPVKPSTPATSPFTDDEMVALVQAARSANIDPTLVLSVYNYESNLNPHAVNPTSGAQGLPQFMPSTLRSFGYKDDPLAFHTLSVTEQLPWIAQLLRSQVSALGSVPTTAVKLWHLNLYPSTARAGLVFSREGDPAAYAGNEALDVGGKGYVDENDLALALTQSDKRAGHQAALEQLGRLMGASTA
jgi:Transglycosylase SLT domain